MKRRDTKRGPANTERQRRARVARALFVIGAHLPWVSCDIGQSGSEAGGGGTGSSNDTQLCPCNAPGTYLRATLIGRDGREVTLRVESVIHGETPLVAGALIRASFDGGLPCYVGTSDPAVGSEVLAAFQPLEQASCDAASCAGEDELRGSVRLTPWSESLLMASTPGGTLTVPAAELDRLWTEPEQCLERYGDWTALPGALSGDGVP